MDCVWQGGPDVPKSGFIVYGYGGVIIWCVGSPYARHNFPYHWEGRQVIPSGGSLTFYTQEDGWSYYMSGYRLDAPLP
jgi:hypothetical protein